MAIINCPECSKEISDKAKSCPHCGAKKKASWLWLKIVLGVPAGLFLLMMLIGSCTPKEKRDTKARDRAAIQLCWEEQSRKSLDPAAARFSASACEMMERNFRGTHNAQP
jgi:hypothetical protein